MKKITKKANKSFYEVILAAKLGETFVSRDNEQFSQMNYDVTTRLPWLTQKVAEALELKTDEAYSDDISMKVREVAAKRSEIMQIMRGFKARVQMANPILLKEEVKLNMRVRKVEAMDVFIHKIGEMVTVLSKKQSLLSGAISVDDIGMLQSKMVELSELWSELGDLKTEREKQTEYRNKLANELYGELQVITALGKAIWYNVDAIKYDDYVLNNYFRKRRITDPPDKNEGEISGNATEGDETNWSDLGEGMR